MRAAPDRRAAVSRPGRPAGRDPEAGFTLIEVLAALVVTAALVAVVLPYASRLATRWWTGEAAVGTADAWMQAIGRMSDDLAQAVPVGLGPDDHLQPAFSAGPDQIAFVRPAIGRPEALETVTYEVRAVPAGVALVRTSRRFDAQGFPNAGAGGASSTLLEGRIRLRLVEIARGGARRRGWTPADGMPAAVELSIADEHPGDGPAAPVVMPIAARAPAVAAGAPPPL